MDGNSWQLGTYGTNSSWNQIKVLEVLCWESKVHKLIPLHITPHHLSSSMPSLSLSLSFRYNLKTIVDPPHQQTVTSLKFRPSTRLQNRNESSSRNENEFNDRHTQLMLATTGMDGKFKVGKEKGTSNDAICFCFNTLVVGSRWKGTRRLLGLWFRWSLLQFPL